MVAADNDPALSLVGGRRCELLFIREVERHDRAEALTFVNSAVDMDNMEVVAD